MRARENERERLREKEGESERERECTNVHILSPVAIFSMKKKR